MELIRENTQTQLSSAELEREKHNAMIKERYKQLQNAEASQFAEKTYTEEKRVAETAYANVEAPEKPALYISPNNNMNAATLEQMPKVTEYISQVASALFTPERFERMQSFEEEETVAHVATATPVIAPMPVQAAAVKVEAQYSLSSFAKMAMAVFTLVIVAMLTLICINTSIINQKAARIESLEQQKEQLLAESEAVQQRIAEAKSEETIREFAESQGMVQVGK